jgi:2-oxoglutarate ferredoxin oxidoreductase subunit alpha
MKKDFSLIIGGKAGQGSRSAGAILGKILKEYGYKVYIYEDYQSLIKGGHNFSEIRFSEKGFFSRKKEIDFLLALDKETIDFHQKDLKKDGIIVFDSSSFSFDKGIGIEAKKIVEKEKGLPIMANTVLVSAFSKILGIDWQIVKDVFEKEIKTEKELNLKLAKEGYEISKTIFKIPKLKLNKDEVLLTGNEATAIGLSRAGLIFYFAYPMTPATSIMNYFAKREDLNVKVVQPENEIAVINMALGAAFAGKKSALGTSGGGFALMTEALSLAGQSETPIFIIESQRGGPSTGMPTYNLQGDLLFVLSAGHGDFPRFVIAPGDAQECLLYSALGLNLAWKYQTPVIFLLDKDLSENTFFVNEKLINFSKSRISKNLLNREFAQISRMQKEYKRYEITKDGISPLAFPGMKGIIVKATSYEHDEFGITIDSEDVVKMQEKRMRKYETMKKEVEKLPAVKVYGNKKSKIALVTFGITKGPAIEAAENLGLKVIQPIIIEPFASNQMRKALEGVKKLFSVELNTTGQLAKVLKSQGINVKSSILKYNGRPFFAKEIEEKIKKELKK